MASDEDEDEKAYKFSELSPDAQEHALERWREKGWAWDDGDTEMLTETFKEDLEALGLPHDNVHWQLSYSQGDGVAFEGNLDVGEYLKKNKLLRDYASLFAPAFEEKDVGRPVGHRQQGQAEDIAGSLERLGFMTRVRHGKDCFYVDVFEANGKVERLATFCVSVKRGRQGNVSVESESESGNGAWLLKRAGERFTSVERRTNYDIPMDMLSFRITSSSRYYSMNVEYELNIPDDWLSPEQKRDLEALHEHIKEHVEGVASDLRRQGYEEMEYKASDEAITETIEANDYDFDENGNMK